MKEKKTTERSVEFYEEWLERVSVRAATFPDLKRIYFSGFVEQGNRTVNINVTYGDYFERLIIFIKKNLQLAKGKNAHD